MYLFSYLTVYPLPKKPSLNTDTMSNYWPILNLNLFLNFLHELLKFDSKPTYPSLLQICSTYHKFHSTKEAPLSVHSDIILLHRQIILIIILIINKCTCSTWFINRLWHFYHAICLYCFNLPVWCIWFGPKLVPIITYSPHAVCLYQWRHVGPGTTHLQCPSRFSSQTHCFSHCTPLQ